MSIPVDFERSTAIRFPFIAVVEPSATAHYQCIPRVTILELKDLLESFCLAIDRSASHDELRCCGFPHSKIK